MSGPAAQGQGVGVGASATEASFVVLLAAVPNSATATPARQKTATVKTRRLKKADREVDFFFMAYLSSLINYDLLTMTWMQFECGNVVAAGQPSQNGLSRVNPLP
jgi:hypothetical protein